MTPDGAIRLISLYASIQEALGRDEAEQAAVLTEEATALIAEPVPAGCDLTLLRALAGQVEAARNEAEAALTTARDRLRRVAAAEMRAGGDGARAYAGSDERPDARFIDRTG